MNVQCLKCKGRGFCGKPVCPIRAKISSQKTFNIASKKDFSGKTPNVFVGKFGYPDVNVGLLTAQDYQHNDEPLFWKSNDYSIKQVVDLRTQLINSNFKAKVQHSKNKFLSLSQELGLASKPADVEISLNKAPKFSFKLFETSAPQGPNVKLEKAEITENIRVPTKVDKVVSDTDLKAVKGLSSLFSKGVDEHYLTKILSTGNLGVGKNRKLVPTRWSITAVDDTLSKDLLKEIKNYNNYDYAAFSGEYLGNHYLVLCFPDVWSYELFEIAVNEDKNPWSKNGLQFATDVEFYSGRKEYADETAGGYYAARLAILEKFSQMKRQGSFLVLRFITSEYWAPLGVWVVREASRNAMNSKPIIFDSKELMLNYASIFSKKKFNINLNSILKSSKLLDYQKNQKKIKEFN